MKNKRDALEKKVRIEKEDPQKIIERREKRQKLMKEFQEKLKLGV